MRRFQLWAGDWWVGGSSGFSPPLRLIAVLATAISLAGATPALAGAARQSSITTATPAVAYQLNAAHTGVSPDLLNVLPKRRWRVKFAGGVSYPLIVNGLVYVTAADGGERIYGSRLYALNATTGKLVWGPVELGYPWWWSGIAYDAGQVFALNGGGLLRAFDAASGRARWTTQLPGESGFTSAPTAVNGYVYTDGSGVGSVAYAVNESTGIVAWTHPFSNGGNTSPAVSSTGMYLSYACQVYDLSPLTGTPIWQREAGCSGGGGTTPVLAGGRLYVREAPQAAVLSAETGALLGPLEARPAPAVDSSRAYILRPDGHLVAEDSSTQMVAWSFIGDGALNTSPIVSGGTVIEGTSLGHLYGLSAASGALLWTLEVGSPIVAPEEGGVRQPLTGLATSAGSIIVPAGSTLLAYR